uniref:Serpin domain-containing protein n=1 Tax=Megaselia scalaris TaxID=36166 RepID=T1GYR1_MEGSC
MSLSKDKNFIAYLCVILVITQCLCQQRNILQTVVQRIDAPPEIQRALKSISEGSEQFALELFTKAATALKDENSHYGDFMISPFSVWSLLVLMVEGASGNTLAELQKTLRINTDLTAMRTAYERINQALRVNTTTLQVSTLQAIFSDINRPVDRDYEDVVERIYRANLVPINFHNSKESANIVNDFVNRETRGLIKQLVYQEDLSEAQMILISAIFFRGQWTMQDDVPERIFFYAAIPQLDSHVIELPYGVENRLSMIVVVPKKGVRLYSVIEKLASVGTSGIFNGLKKAKEDAEYYDEEMEVDLFLPRFTTDTDFALNSLLIQMGIHDLFNAKNANLGKISSHPIYLSRLYHKTTIEVTEEGTVASAATAGILTNKISPTKFQVNRPFAYMIVEKSTGSMLFVGQVKNPGVV